MEYVRCIRATVNLAYIRRRDGRYIILTASMISREVNTPQQVNGYALFPDGRLAVFAQKTNLAALRHTPNVANAF